MSYITEHYAECLRFVEMSKCAGHGNITA